MSLFGSLFKTIKKIVKKVIDMIKKFIKKFWLIILIVVIIVFAPYIAPMLLSWGMPTLSAFFSTIATSVTPYVTSALSWAWSGISSAGSAAYGAFSSLSFGTQASLVTGAAALIAPEETGQLIGDVVSTVGSAAGSVIGGIADGVGGLIGNLAKKVPTWAWLAGGGALVWWLLPSDGNKNG